ncbi:MAG TPA: DUF5666 domain-containing protein [Ktedonobacterales bacterium]|nr:DUF5666 domain-containing protein [Ktedonobacterales bacterium]
MDNYGNVPAMWQAPPLAPRPRGNGRRWLLVACLALALTLALGIGALLGSTIGTTQAAGVTPGGANSAQTQPGGPSPRGQGQCGVLTVSSVSGQTIVAKAPDGSTVTIHTTASTQYTHAGQTATASAVTVGSSIHVDGTRNSDGSIAATRIDVR